MHHVTIAPLDDESVDLLHRLSRFKNIGNTMKRRFAKFALIAISVVTISLAFVPESKAHLFSNLFGHGYRSSYYGYGYSAYRPSYYGHGYSAYRPSYFNYRPRTSYYHAPLYTSGYRSFSNRCSPCGNGYSTGYASHSSYSLNGSCHNGCQVGGHSSGECGFGGCSTGNCGVSTGEQSSIKSQPPTPAADDYDKDSGTFKKFERKDDVDDTGSREFKKSREKAPIPQREKDDPFGGTNGLNNNTSIKGSDDGLGGRKSEDETPLIESPKLPASGDDADPFGGNSKKLETFKIPASQKDDAVKKTEAVNELDDIMDDHNNPSKVIQQGQGAPTKTPIEETPVEDESSSIRKQPAEMPQLKVEPIGLDDHIAWRTIPTYRRLSIRSRYSAPRIARTRVESDRNFLSPIHSDTETKLVSK